jgi:hypothetical protein
MFDDLGLMKRRFWLNSSTAAAYILFFCHGAASEHQFFSNSKKQVQKHMKGFNWFMEWSCIISAYLRMVEKFGEESEDLEDCAWSG